jgi:hypothetical protein
VDAGGGRLDGHQDDEDRAMCMSCASQAPAVTGQVSALLAYGSAVGATALGALGLRWDRRAHRGGDLEALAQLVDARDEQLPSDRPKGR